ncbi:hypothetical protein DOK67_0000241 [Enterococcus sp. DIV0212c]
MLGPLNADLLWNMENKKKLLRFYILAFKLKGDKE